MQNNHHYIAGIDEAGRGPWAGPVCVAAVVLNPDRQILGLNDSKKLSEAKREILFEEICMHALAVSSVFVNVAQIDTMNIREATLHGMEQAILALSIKPDEILIDGRDVPNGLKCKNAHAIVKGDAIHSCISAASIVAKVLRDRAMHVLDTQFPEYGFAQHKGYGTVFHSQALKIHGACEMHRKSFAPIRNLLKFL